MMQHVGMNRSCKIDEEQMEGRDRSSHFWHTVMHVDKGSSTIDFSQIVMSLAFIFTIEISELDGFVLATCC